MEKGHQHELQLRTGKGGQNASTSLVSAAIGSALWSVLNSVNYIVVESGEEKVGLSPRQNHGAQTASKGSNPLQLTTTFVRNHGTSCTGSRE